MRRAIGFSLVIAVALSAAGCQPQARSSPDASGRVASGPAASGTPGPWVTGQPAPSGISVDVAARGTDRPPGGDPGLLEAIPRVRVIASWTTPLLDTPGGRPIDPGGATAMGTGLELAVLGEPVSSAGSRWYRAFALPNQQYGPAGYFGWIPADPDGSGGKTLGVPASCPLGDTGISDLATLDPFTRARCLGAASLDFEGYVGDFPLPVWYDVDPLWLGHPQDGRPDSAFSLHAGPGIYPYFSDSPSVDLQLPPGLEHPPWGFRIAVRVHVADAAAATCRRTVPPSFEAAPETTADSVLWCSTRLVVEQWRPLLGSEGRPIDPAAPQLHRHPAAGANTACAGVGMSPLTFHVDPSALDPVWLQVSGATGGHIVASFDPSFHAIYTPELVVVDGDGRVVVRDGTPLDPDGTLDGHWICPMGSVVSIDAAKASR